MRSGSSPRDSRYEMPSTSAPLTEGEGTTSGRFMAWLDRPLSGRHCVLAWVLGTIVFLGMVALMGGPASNDSGESLYSTWAIAHGDFGCAYPHVTQALAQNYLPIYLPGPHVPPLWPLVSGVIAAAGGIGGSAPFPSAHALGPGCNSVYPALFAWAHSNRTLWPTLGIGYLSWFALLSGVIAVVRASGRGRRGWEALAVLLVAMAPVVWEPILDEFHPQDLLAMGLILGGIACFQRRWWAWSGVLLGLAVASHQFALLVLLPLFILAPGNRRWRLAGLAAGAWCLIGLPFVATGGRNALNGLIVGTGDWFTFGGTVLWETGLRGHSLVFASRVLPILACVAIAWWARHRLGSRVFEPAILLSLLATTLSLRLVFEQGLFGYKFMALAVMLIVLCVVRRRRMGETLTWLALVTLASEPIPLGLAFNARTWGHSAAVALPVVAAAAIFGLIIWDACHRRVRWYLVAGLLVTLLAFVPWPWTAELRPLSLVWLVQILLVPPGIALAVEPMVSAMRVTSVGLSDSTVDSVAVDVKKTTVTVTLSEP